MLREIMELTNSEAREHGFVVIGEPGDLNTTHIITGSNDSIDVSTHTTSAFRPTRVSVHTHPGGAIVPSDSDWRSFLTEHSQYGTSRMAFPDGWRRGLVVAGQRLGEDDQFGIRSLELTPAGAGLSITEQRDWIDDAFGVLTETRVGKLGSANDIADEIGPQVRTCTKTVQLEAASDG